MGSSVDLARRFSMYFSEKVLIKELDKMNSQIYRALLKYGYSKFSLEILEYCEAEETVNREQYYIDLLDPEYNLCPIAGSSLGRKVSDETRAKLVRAHVGRDYSGLIEHLAKLKQANLGRKHSEETKDKIRASALGLSSRMRLALNLEEYLLRLRILKLMRQPFTYLLVMLQLR